MSIAEGLLPEFDHEMSVCRKFIERAPRDKFDWKPHEKSMTLGRLVSHLAEIPAWTVTTLEESSLNFAPKDGSKYTSPVVSTPEEAVALLDKNVKDARVSLTKAPDGCFAEPWSLMNGDFTIFTHPKSVVLRSFVLSHLVHHRAQLGVYFRLLGVPVPSSYGPSAEDMGM